jgi:DNA invertase Pin-like site-specific DNA recombinase
VQRVVLSLPKPILKSKFHFHSLIPFLECKFGVVSVIFGYARVSTQDQNLDAQIDALKSFGAEKIFQEKITGTKKDRPELLEMTKLLREGDIVVVLKLDRISRSTKHLIELTEMFDDKGVHFVSIQDNLDTKSAMGKFFFRIIASISELERYIISERTKVGLNAARARGRKGGRPKKDPKKLDLAIKMYNSKQHTLKEIADLTGVGKTTLYRRIKEEK